MRRKNLVFAVFAAVLLLNHDRLERWATKLSDGIFSPFFITDVSCISIKETRKRYFFPARKLQESTREWTSCHSTRTEFQLSWFSPRPVLEQRWDGTTNGNEEVRGNFPGFPKSGTSTSEDRRQEVDFGSDLKTFRECE